MIAIVFWNLIVSNERKKVCAKEREVDKLEKTKNFTLKKKQVNSWWNSFDMATNKWKTKTTKILPFTYIIIYNEWSNSRKLIRK